MEPAVPKSSQSRHRLSFAKARTTRGTPFAGGHSLPRIAAGIAQSEDRPRRASLASHGAGASLRLDTVVQGPDIHPRPLPRPRSGGLIDRDRAWHSRQLQKKRCECSSLHLRPRKRDSLTRHKVRENSEFGPRPLPSGRRVPPHVARGLTF